MICLQEMYNILYLTSILYTIQIYTHTMMFKCVVYRQEGFKYIVCAAGLYEEKR